MRARAPAIAVTKRRREGREEERRTNQKMCQRWERRDQSLRLQVKTSLRRPAPSRENPSEQGKELCTSKWVRPEVKLSC